MTKEEAQKKMCPFMKRSKHNTDADIHCRTTACMAWGWQLKRKNAIDTTSGYCKRLA